MRGLAAFLLVVMALFGASQPACADKRVALVIGNSGYKNVQPLPNPAHDAASVAEMFRAAKFDVVEFRQDLGNTQMRRTLNDFFDRTSDADMAVVYYAGHGIEVDGQNYLIPTDAQLERDRDVYDEAISLERVLQSIEPAKKLRLVILDACRDNPFNRKMKRTLASRGIARGLAGVEPDRTNTLVAFAARAGSTAADGDDGHSPFTTALLNHLTTPGLDLRKAFGMVRDDVMSATDNRQEPFVYGSLGGSDVSLVPPLPPKPAAATDPNAAIRTDYELAERVGTQEAWDSFLTAHGSGFYADLARAQRNKLMAERARLAATEKARQANEEQLRLAVEGARASEQSKAAAATKAAEVARIAAEKAKAAEEAKVVAAEKARAEAEARADAIAREAAEKIAQLELARAAQAARLDEQRKAAERAQAEEQKKAAAAAQQVASLTPPQQAAPEAGKPADKAAVAVADIPRLLQSELKRVGCMSSETSGAWDPASQRALAAFNDRAGTKFDVKLASLDALDAVRNRVDRVCPLECARGTRAEGDRCVRITCDGDRVPGADGVCRKRPERPARRPARQATREPRAPAASSHGKCFAFNGRQYCE